MAAPATDVSAVLVEGPWRHRLIAAHGARFHVAELGEGPLVLLLHVFPQDSGFEKKVRLNEFQHLQKSERALATLAEQYAGLPF